MLVFVRSTSVLIMRFFIIFSSILAVAFCEKDGHHGGHHHLYFHEFYYLIFLALKFKIIFVIGSIWTFGLIVAKIFAFFKISEYMKKNSYHNDHYEKVVYTNPHDSLFQYSDVFGKNDVGAFHPEISFDQLPHGTVEEPYSDYSHGTLDGGHIDKVQVQQTGYGRSIQRDDSGYHRYFKAFSHLIQKYKITELVFKEMNITSNGCKRKFICEADYSSQQNSLLKTAFTLFSDETYRQYKTNNTAGFKEECATLNPDCYENT